jgi:hypothetical protein
MEGGRMTITKEDKQAALVHLAEWFPQTFVLEKYLPLPELVAQPAGIVVLVIVVGPGHGCCVLFSAFPTLWFSRFL